MTRLPACLLVAAVALLLPGCVGQRPSDLLSNLPPASPDDLTAVYYFPEHPDKQIPAGEIISVVVSARNTGSRPLNLSAITGSINSAAKYEVFIQNFTIGRYFAPLAPGAEASLEYKFRADPVLGSSPAREFQVALHLLYESHGSYYSSTFFNQTVDIGEVPRVVDFDLVWLALTVAALLAAAAHFGHAAVAERLGLVRGLRGKRKRAARAEVHVTAIDGDDWVKGTHYDVQKRRRAAVAAAQRKA